MTHELTRPYQLSRRWYVHLEFKIQRAWIGCCWTSNGTWTDLWICLIPCFPIHFWSIQPPGVLRP